jgi:hypothetical protein
MLSQMVEKLKNELERNQKDSKQFQKEVDQLEYSTEED